MLKPGGRMMYATCTFNPLENEEAVSCFLDDHPDFALADLPRQDGWQPGLLPETRLLMPHLIRGEGHFLALLQKTAGSETPMGHGFPEGAGRPGNWQDFPPLLDFMKAHLSEGHLTAEGVLNASQAYFAAEGQYLYQRPAALPSLKGLKLLRPGWFVGRLKNGRFEPSQALAMGLKPAQARRVLRLDREDALVGRYLRGETLLAEGPKGWTLVCLEDWPLGFAKQMEGYLKNHYPPGWRTMH
jgi:NOL1/NOP2/fmu family ribosome biogenesis protein